MGCRVRPIPAPRPPRTLAYIRWFDASYQRGEVSDDEIVPRVELESAGILAKETQDTVSIALDRYEHDGLWRYIQNIPKVNIISMRKIKV